MKKTIFFLFSILLLNPVFASNKIYVDKNANSNISADRIIYLDDYSAQLEFENKTIPTSNTIIYDFEYIGHCDYLDMYFSSSVGAISTANVSWRTSQGTELQSETLTAGTPITTFKSMFLRFTITVTSNRTITGNILISND